MVKDMVGWKKRLPLLITSPQSFINHHQTNPIRTVFHTVSHAFWTASALAWSSITNQTMFPLYCAISPALGQRKAPLKGLCHLCLCFSIRSSASMLSLTYHAL